MSRVIKFRAWWHKKQKMLHEVHDFYDTLGDVDHGNTEEPECSFGGILDHPDKYAVMQFTGLTDRNGVDIYESDVVRDHVGIGRVEWHEGKAAFRVNYENGEAKWFIDYTLRGEHESIEVIGNIYENPELLEAKP